LLDPLARRLRDSPEHVLFVASLERQGDPVPRRLDLLDRVEADPGELRPVAARRGELGVGGDDGHLALPQPRDDLGETLARCLRPRDAPAWTLARPLRRFPGGDGPPREIRAPAAPPRPAASEDERGEA